MRKSLFPATILPALFLVTCGISLHAQGQPEFSIKKIDSAFFETPQIAAGTYRKQQPGGARPVPWLEVDVNFERDEVLKDAAKFSDDLTVNFYILLNNAAINENKQPTLLTGTTTISDVPYGRVRAPPSRLSSMSVSRFQMQQESLPSPLQRTQKWPSGVRDGGNLIPE